MFKLAWTDGWINLKRSFRETKYLYLLLTITLVAGVFWREMSPVVIAWYVGTSSTLRPDYGKGKLIPDIFYIVPMSEKEKKRYILYRAFGIEWIICSIIGAIMIYEVFFLDRERLWIGLLLMVLWLCMMFMKEQFYRIYKQINGKTYYPDMSTVNRWFFWIFRTSDFIFGLIALIGAGTVTSDSGTHSLSIYLGPVVVIYMVISLLYFTRYVQNCMERMELPEML